MTAMPALPGISPAHVHPTRMRHISDADLAAGIGRPGDSIPAIRSHLASRPGRRPVWDPADRARALAGTAAADAELDAARALLDRRVDFLSTDAGRSGMYGLHYLDWLDPLVIAYELTGDQEFPAGYARHFSDWYASRDLVTGEWPGLDVVWYSLGVWARARNLVPALTSFAAATGFGDDVFAQALKTVLGGARWAAEEHLVFRPGNWQLVCATELLHIAAFLPDAGESTEWAAVGRSRLIEHLEHDFYSDGGHLERSPGYHALCLNALQRAQAIATYGLGAPIDHPQIAAAHDWLAAMAAPSGWVPAWQDSQQVQPGPALLRGQRLAPDPVRHSLIRRWLTTEQIHRTLRELPHRPPEPDPVDEFDAAPDAVRAPGTTVLAGSGYLMMRGPAPAETFMALNVGPYVEHELESHSHLAVTDFVIEAHGVPLAVEAGGPISYDHPDYQTWFRAPIAHNCVTLPGEPMSQDRRCRLDRCTTAGCITLVEAHHHGYRRRLDRRIIFVAAAPEYWLITDTVSIGNTVSINDAADGPIPAVWSILGPHAWHATDNGFRSASAPGLVVVPAETPQKTSFDVGPGRLPGVAGYAELHGLRLHADTGRFDVLVAPFAERAANWTVERIGDGWRISDGTVVDTLTPGRWRRAEPTGTATTVSWPVDDPATIPPAGR